MPRYPVVLLDLDHTLFDSDASERAAFAVALAAEGIDGGTDGHAGLLDTYVAINTALWAAVERGECTATAVRTERFERLVRAAGLDADPHRLADAFVAGLAACGELYAGAADVLDELRTWARLALVTNGLSEVQRARIERLGLAAHFDAVVISGEIGAAKPAAAFFRTALERLGHPTTSDVLMVGDSLSADIGGGAAYGLTTCWYNPSGRPLGGPVVPDHVIADLAALPPLVRGD